MLSTIFDQLWFPVHPLTVAAFSLAGIIIVATAAFYFETQRRQRKNIPSPPSHPLFGHALLASENYHRLPDFYYDCSKKLGLTSYMYVPFQPPMIVTNDWKNLEYMLKTNFENFEKGPNFYDIQLPLLGQGIFNTDGEAWKVQRKTASHIFNVRNFRDFMMVVFEGYTATLCDILERASETETIVDLHDLFYRFTLDSFSEIGFGVKLGALKSVEPIAFAAAFDRAQKIIDERFVLPKPVWEYGELLNGKRAQLNHCVKVMDEFAYKMIADRKADPDREAKSDLLSRFVNLKDLDGNGYSDKELRDIVLNFIIAGRDTTAQALSWAIFLLTQNPRVMQKFREEITNVTPDSYPSYESWKDLKYGQFVFSEALRLYPSVPKNVKHAKEDCVFPDGTKVCKGDGIVWSPYAMGRLEEIWGPDAREFKPERWEAGHPGQFKYPVFNAGPRVCLGMQMAQIEGVSCLTELLKRFDFELVQDPKKITYAPALTLMMKGGLEVRVKKRKC
ncbi:cytochrome P450 [Paraphysoderma sedebokerense]|nr:cytochrome P450 [Paraphysoderma sedebokerense]